MLIYKLFTHRKTIHFIRMQLFLILFFAILYYLVANHTTKKKGIHFIDNVPPFNFIDALYLSLVTHSTVGYGDISPKSNIARVIAGLQMLTIIFSFALYFVA